jgi:Na+-driven multidrug efflux pump
MKVWSAHEGVGNNFLNTKVQKFFEVFVYGIDTAGAAMIGQNLDAQKIQRASATV